MFRDKVKLFTCCCACLLGLIISTVVIETVSYVIDQSIRRLSLTQRTDGCGRWCHSTLTGIKRPFHEHHTFSTMKTTLYYQPSTNIDHFSENENAADGLATTKIFTVKSNRELAEERQQVYRAKREARQKSIESSNERNYQLKELLHRNNSSSDRLETSASNGVVSQSTNVDVTNSEQHSNIDRPQPLYQVKILVAESFRQELKLTGREKRGRVFIPVTSNSTYNMMALRAEMHGFFRALKKDSYMLYGGYPMLSDEGTIIASIFNTPNNTTDPTAETRGEQEWPILSDADVQLTFQRANDWYESQLTKSSTIQLKRPSIVIHVKKNPNMLPPPPPPEYLANMSDPTESTHMSMLSFYSFPQDGIDDPTEYAVTLRKLWKPFHALGRIYIAHEGINAQMSVPTNVISNFQECCHSLPNGVGEYLQQNGGINIDPIPLTSGEYAVAGIQAAATVPFTNTTGNDDSESTEKVPPVPTPPFSNLHIRVRQQIVADGLDKPYDWQKAGYDMPALEWHEKLNGEIERRKNGEDLNDTGIRLLDCRNSYESDVGRFEGSEPLETHTFRDSWDALKERLAGTPKDAPIMTYCTGGIRCVKVGAYLTQELGFTNVSRLAGGIIAYDRILNEKAPQEQPLFKGTNFVFDGRLGRPITEDSLGTCLTCGSETSAVSNCRNENCHKRIVQCENCRTSFAGTCSDECRHRIVNGAMRYRRNSMSDSSDATSSTINDQDQTARPIFKTLDEYSQGHSSPVPSVYPEIELNTRVLIPSGAHMVSGNAQGKLLTQLASMTREGRILELGTFTGYGTACLLVGSGLAGRALPGNNAVGSRESGPFVLTMERDAKAYDVAVSHMTVISELGINEAAAESLCALRVGNNLITNVSDSASVSLEYDNVTTIELLKVSDGLAIVEAMSEGRGDLQPAPFDLVFLDADKTRLLDYTEALLSSNRVLKPGGIIVVDNVLWKGLVLEASNGNFSSLQEFANDEEEVLRRNRRARKLATKMHRFNSEIVKDYRVDVLVLPMRDGLSVIRKK